MPSTKTISFEVPSHFEVPEAFVKASPELRQHALLLADALLDTGTNYTNETKIKELQDQIRSLKSTTIESLREESVRIVKGEMRAEVIGKENLLIELRNKVEEYKHMLEDLRNEKQQLSEYLRHKESKVEELQEKLQHRIAVQSNSSKRGLEGERDFQIITSNFRNWILESIGQTQKESTDFRSTIHSLEVRFEVKNHESLVSYLHNVDKFERDMRKHPETKVGIFIALTARIEKLEDFLTTRWTENKQLLIFIPHFLQRDLAYTYDILEGYIRTMKYVSSYLEEKNSSADIQSLSDKLEKTVSNVQLLDKYLQTAMKDHFEHNTKMNATFQAQKSVILTSLNLLTGKEEEENKPKRKGRGKKPVDVTEE